MNRVFRIISFQGLSTAAAAFAMTVVAGDANAGPPLQNAVVKIANFTFSPPTLTVRPGTTVTWVNDDDIPHTVVSKDGVFKSKVLDTGDRFSFSFAKPGQFGYFCSIHPHMTGTIVVKT
jgi:plastocyanin